MAFSQTWDLEKYKSEFESEEHWQLRKKFMQEHKNQFPEEKLVCLARVFCNIEFLGCRYPEKTMKLVAELSKGVADDYREKQKGKLKRTFVQASDAAEAKAKGRGATPPDKITEGSQSKIPKISAPGTKYPCFVHEGVVKPRVQIKSDFPGFIIYESCKTTCPINILTQSAQKSKIWNSISFEFPAEKNSDPNNRCCEIFLNKKLLSSGTGKTNKGAKVDAATEGLKKLRETCYTIQEKLSFFTDGEVVSKEQVEKKKETIALPQDNIGSKMMMKMGWTGAGLGKNQQGIKAPIEAAQTMRRAGFGHLSMPQFHTKFRNVFKDYIASGSTNDLVFAPDFSADERKILHKLAQGMNLKTKSHGKNDQRQLVVFKSHTLQEILDILLRCGGENEKYSLLYPDRIDPSCTDALNDLEQVDEEMPVDATNIDSGSAEEEVTYAADESEIEIINRLIEKKNNDMIILQNDFDNLLRIYNETQTFTKKQKRRYILARKQLQNMSGTFILNILKPKLTMEDFKRGRYPLSDGLNNFNMRCETIAMAELEKNKNLIKKLIHNVRVKLNIPKLVVNKQSKRAIRMELCRIGSTLTSDSLFIKKEPKLHNSRKKNRYYSKLKNEWSGSKSSKPRGMINFVKGQTQQEDESSGMGDSDDDSDYIPSD